MTTPNTPQQPSEPANESEGLQDLLKGAATSDSSAPKPGRRPRYLPPVQDDSKKPRFNINIPLPQSSGPGSYGQSNEVEDSLFAFEGRMGRLSYQAGVMLLGVFAVLAIFIGSKILGILITSIVVFIAFLVFYVMLTKRRLHDLNVSGWYMLVPIGSSFVAGSMQMAGISFAPTLAAIISFLFTFALILIPGTAGDNDYGQVRHTSTLEKIIGWVCFVLLASSYLFNMSHRHRVPSTLPAPHIDGLTAEQQAQYDETMKKLTPEQQERFAESMKKLQAMQEQMKAQQTSQSSSTTYTPVEAPAVTP